MNELSIEEIKLYTKIDNTEEDDLLKLFRSEAEEYLTEAGITKDYSKTRYKLVVLMMIADNYENREIKVEGKQIVVNDKISKLILQLQLGEGSVVTYENK